MVKIVWHFSVLTSLHRIFTQFVARATRYTISLSRRLWNLTIWKIVMAWEMQKKNTLKELFPGICLRSLIQNGFVWTMDPQPSYVIMERVLTANWLICAKLVQRCISRQKEMKKIILMVLMIRKSKTILSRKHHSFHRIFCFMMWGTHKIQDFVRN